MSHEIVSVETRNELLAELGNSTHTRQPVLLEPEERDIRIPEEWYNQGSKAVSYRGRQFRSMQGGGVRILSGTEMTDLPPVLDKIDKWKIHIAPSGPLGYGSGVFELDNDLRPVRWLIRPNVKGEDTEHAGIIFIQSDSKTIGIVMFNSEGVMMQVYSRQGVLLNEAPLGEYLSGWAEPSQFIKMGDGYLFSDGQLVWISATGDNRVWRFGPPLARTSTERWGESRRYFGDPLLSNGCLYVIGLDGGLLIFDAAKVASLACVPVNPPK